MAHLGARGWATSHGTKEIKKGKDKYKVCKIYSTISCDDHVELGKTKWSEILGEKEVALPQHVFVDAAGKVLSRKAGSMTAQDLVKEINDAVAKIEGPKIPKGDYDVARSALRDGEDLVKKDEIKKAIAAFTKVTKSTHPPLAKLGDDQLKNLQSSGDARVEAAIQQMSTNVDEAAKVLKKVAEEYKPLECATKAADILKAMAEKKE